jgi:CheY-like chemotaxis protein
MTDPVSEAKLSSREWLSGKRILVVDEDEFVRDLITKVLTRYLGLEVFAASSGGEAIAAALSGRYDGAIIDLIMPHTSGIKVIQTIRTMLPDFPMIGMAANVSENTLCTIRRFGITKVLGKPFKMTALIEGITEILGADNILSKPERGI